MKVLILAGLVVGAMGAAGADCGTGTACAAGERCVGNTDDNVNGKCHSECDETKDCEILVSTDACDLTGHGKTGNEGDNCGASAACDTAAGERCLGHTAAKTVAVDGVDADEVLGKCWTWVTGICEPHGEVSGDPHFQNINQEKFDVFQTGDMTLLQIPRNAAGDAGHLTIRARVENVAKARCATDSLFLRQIDLAGSWAGEAEHVSFRAGLLGSPTPFGMQLGAGPWLAHTDVKEQEIRANDAPEIGGKMGIRTAPGKVEVSLLFSEVHVLVSQRVRRRGFQNNRAGHFALLDVTIFGLESVKEEIGGLLGLDGHAKAASNDCQQTARKSRKFDQRLDVDARTNAASLVSRAEAHL